MRVCDAIILVNFLYFIKASRLYDELHNKNVCDGFMTLLAGRKPWMEQENCFLSFLKMDQRIRMLSAQMKLMNSSLTVYTSYSYKSPRCNYQYPGIILEAFNASELLYSYGFGDALGKMSNWSLQGHTRTSDIIRLALAHRYKKTYIDMDIIFMKLNSDYYNRNFVSACLWNTDGPTIEITNSAFCLQRNILETLLTEQKIRILSGTHSYHYTELGPMLFLKTILNNQKIFIYSQNSPKFASVNGLVHGVRSYGHYLLHLTTAIRKFYRNAYILNLRTIRSQLSLPPLFIPPSTMVYGSNSRASTQKSTQRRGNRTVRADGEEGAYEFWI